MKAALLAAYKRGEINHRTLDRESAKSLLNLATWHHRKWSSLYQPTRLVEVDDLVQVARIAMWTGVEAYVWRCSVCERDAGSEADFATHVALRHPEGAEASPTLVRWVTGCVGNAILAEIRATVKRAKVRPTIVHVGRMLSGEASPDDLGDAVGPMPAHLRADLSVAADQEARIDLGRLLAAAGPRVQAQAAEIRAALIEGRAVG